MELRPATDADLPAVTALYAAYDTAWFGAPEHDADEVGEELGHAAGSALAVDGDRVLGLATWTRTGASVVLDPGAAHEAAAGALVDAAGAHGADEVETLDRDTALRAALAARGWAHHHSSFELIRDVTPDWDIAAPVWPDGVQVRGRGPDDAERLHRLIYREAGWAEVPGHPERSLEEWRALFVTEHEVPAEQLLAWDGDALVGAAIGRTWSDGTGWVAQLAVARSHRGHGLGRALLLAALRLRAAAGAQRLGLSVEAANRNALALYLGVGLALDREWMTFRRNT